jgi:chemotaxis protein CheC
MKRMSERILQSSDHTTSSDDYCWTTKNLMNLETLLEIGTMGAGHATTALSDILHERIIVEVPRLHTAPPHLVPKIYNRHDQPTTVVYMQLRGELDCDIMLAFEVPEAKKIAALMTVARSPAEVDPALEKSAIEELGSIMICAFLSAMADFAGVQLVPTPPQLIVDSFDAIIDGFLAKQALVSDIALIFDTGFKRSGSSAEGTIVLFPSLELQELLIKKSQKWLT